MTGVAVGCVRECVTTCSYLACDIDVCIQAFTARWTLPEIVYACHLSLLPSFSRQTALHQCAGHRTRQILRKKRSSGQGLEVSQWEVVCWDQGVPLVIAILFSCIQGICLDPTFGLRPLFPGGEGSAAHCEHRGPGIRCALWAGNPAGALQAGQRPAEVRPFCCDWPPPFWLTSNRPGGGGISKSWVHNFESCPCQNATSHSHPSHGVVVHPLVVTASV